MKLLRCRTIRGDDRPGVSLEKFPRRIETLNLEMLSAFNQRRTVRGLRKNDVGNTLPPSRSTGRTVRSREFVLLHVTLTTSAKLERLDSASTFSRVSGFSSQLFALNIVFLLTKENVESDEWCFIGDSIIRSTRSKVRRPRRRSWRALRKCFKGTRYSVPGRRAGSSRTISYRDDKLTRRIADGPLGEL